MEADVRGLGFGQGGTERINSETRLNCPFKDQELHASQAWVVSCRAGGSELAARGGRLVRSEEGGGLRLRLQLSILRQERSAHSPTPEI